MTAFADYKTRRLMTMKPNRHLPIAAMAPGEIGDGAEFDGAAVLLLRVTTYRR